MQFFSPKTEFRLILFFEFKQKNIQVKIFAQHQLGSLKWYYYNLLEKFVVAAESLKMVSFYYVDDNVDGFF